MCRRVIASKPDCILSLSRTWSDPSVHEEEKCLLCLDNVPTDPSQNAYVYSITDGVPEIVCLGPGDAE